jgi:hypothetical protein
MRVLAVASGTSADELDVGVVDLAVGGGELVLEVVSTTSAAQRILGRISPGHEPLRMPPPVVLAPRRLRIVAAAPAGGFA